MNVGWNYFQASLPTVGPQKSVGTVGTVGSKEPWVANRRRNPQALLADFQASLPSEAVVDPIFPGHFGQSSAGSYHLERRYRT